MIWSNRLLDDRNQMIVLGSVQLERAHFLE